MQKKKSFLSLLSVAAFSSVFAVSACGGGGGGGETPPPHTHAYTDTVVTPNCVSGGYTLHECACGDSYRDAETDPLGHSYTVHKNNAERHWSVCERCMLEENGSEEEHEMRPSGQGVKCTTCDLNVQESEGLAFTLNGDKTGYIVSAGNFSSPVLVIPETYEGKPVVEIADNAFSQLTGAWIRNIVLPSSLTAIGTKAWSNFRANRVFFRGTAAQWCGVSFKELSSNPVYGSLSKELWINGELLTALDVPAAVTEIKDYAFAECAFLESVSLSDNVAKVGKQAFYGSGVKTVKLPDGLNDMANDAFADCHIENIISDGGRYVVKGNCWVDTQTKTLLYGSADSVIPTDGSVTKIAAGAFNGIAVKKIVIPDCVTEIGEGAFKDCTALSEVTLGKGIDAIPQNAFYGCASLHKVVIPDTVKTIGVQAFGDCSGLVSVTLGRGVTAIEGQDGFLGSTSAFGGCAQLFEVYNLSSLKITKGDRGNGGVARYAQDVHTDASVKSKYAVTEEGFAFYDGSESVFFVGYEGANPSVTLPAKYGERQYSVAINAFRNNTVIENVVIPDGILAIGNNTFWGASALKTVKIGSGPEQLNWNNFYQCTSLESVTLPDTLNKLGRWVFKECVSLREIDIPDGVTEIGDSAFEECTLLARVKLPRSLSAMGEQTFYRCVSLEEIALPDSLNELPSGAFSGCRALSSVGLGSGLKTVGSRAFYNCASLLSIDFKNVETVESSAFSACEKLENISFGAVTEIQSSAFASCVALRSINLGSVQTLGQQAFYQCANLESVNFGSSLQTIGAYAFMYCSALKEANLPDTVRTVAQQAFCYCAALEKAELGSGTEEIGTFAFYGTKIPYIVIPESVTTIGAYAFTVEEGTGCADIYCEAASAPDGWAEGWNAKTEEEQSAVHFAGTWQLVNGIPSVKN